MKFHENEYDDENQLDDGYGFDDEVDGWLDDDLDEVLDNGLDNGFNSELEDDFDGQSDEIESDWEADRIFAAVTRERTAGRENTVRRENTAGGRSARSSTAKRDRSAGRNARRNEKNRQKRKIYGISILVACLLCVGIVAGFFIQRYTPISDTMSGYAYFEISESTENTVILDGELYEGVGTYVDGQLYLPQEFVADNINVRYYYDRESQAVVYTTSTETYTFYAGENNYASDKGNSFTEEHPVVITVGDALYLNWDFVAAHTTCVYAYGTAPARVCIRTEIEETTMVTATKRAAVRYLAGIKSEILETVEEGTQLTYVESIDDWSKVITPSGYTGYVQNAQVSEQVVAIPENVSYVEAYHKIQREEKISLAWFQVASEYGNAYIDDYLAGTSGITVISPTWYSITDETGTMDCYATADFVTQMHNQGMEVWPLVNDFDTNVDFKALYSSKTARTKMINTLMRDAVAYGYDGINIDFENMSSAYGQDFLQFIRELSVACEERNLVLSTDNYKPESYNACYDLKEQSSYVDYIILMAYDEHYAGSTVAGSVASLSFVEEGIQQMLELVPKEQVITAIPFYTRVWTTNASGTSSVAVDMQTALDQLGIYGATALWSEESGQYIMSVESSRGTVQIWFEEDRSIGEKMKKIQEYGLAGVAEWRLGLENSSVWSVINEYLK